MNRIWTCEEAWAWYEKQPWVVGCNYMPSNCINDIAIWQEEGNEEVLRLIDEEIALASEIGMNSVRMGMPFRVWKYQRKGVLQRLEKVLQVLEKYGFTLTPVFFDDCCRGPIENYTDKVLFGKQPEPEPGWHGGFKPRKTKGSNNPTYSMVDDPKNWQDMEQFVKDIVSLHRKDKRILMWDVWNEPGNSGADGIGNVSKSMEIMERVFGWIRQENPIQPLTAGCWDFYTGYFENGECKELTAIEQKALELSDVISFHYYGDYDTSVKLIDFLKKYNRPLFITEWLHRPFGNNVEEMLPLYKKEKIGCYNWGLVNGKSQTHEPWDWIMDWGLDLGKWQHDLFFSDRTPYKQQEIDTFRKLTKKEKKGMSKVKAQWEKTVEIFDLPYFEDAGKDARLLYPGKYGAEYARMVELPDGDWLSVYTIYDNNGYLADPMGGTKLQFSRSKNKGKNWEVVSVLSHPSRDLDNGQMLVLKNGDILLSCRSVRWQESYQLPVYKSTDGGKSWMFWSMIDERNGAPGSLGNPDKGMYEPHLAFLEDGRVSVMYANEKHVTEVPHYSQIISQKISSDNGLTWGEEIWVAWDSANPQLRPGMPVWTRMQDGRYIVVFEVVNLVLTCLESAHIYYKISEDGIHWEAGIGTRIEDQSGGPFIENLSNGWLVVTSLSGQISVSKDYGRTWSKLDELPFESHLWPSLYAQEDQKILLLNSSKRPEGGDRIEMCMGRLSE